MTDHTALLERFARHQRLGVSLIFEEDISQFLTTASNRLEHFEGIEILHRAISFRLDSEASSLEVSFISLSSALESILTFFRRQGEYELIDAKEFTELERDLKKWLKGHPLLAQQPAKRALIYEKIRELNRFPFSYNFEKFCEHYSLKLDDLWPVTGKHADWPLTEIRHRLVHGDPFHHRPTEALACARAHLAIVVERMLLSVVGWPIERSNTFLDIIEPRYERWQEARATLQQSDR